MNVDLFVVDFYGDYEDPLVIWENDGDDYEVLVQKRCSYIVKLLVQVCLALQTLDEAAWQDLDLSLCLWVSLVCLKFRSFL